MRPSRQDVLDILMAVTAFAVATVELRGLIGPEAGPTPRDGLNALQTLPVAVRRRAPVPVFLLVLGASLATMHPFFGTGNDLAGAAFVALQIANYTVNAQYPRVIGLAAASMIPLAILISQLVAAPSIADDLGWLVVMLVVPTTAVAFSAQHIRERRIEAAALQRRAAMLERERDAAAASERARIARELHDVVAHAMSVMVVQAGAARRIVRDDPERAREALRSIEVTGRDALAELRRLLGVLRRDEHDAAALAPQPGLSQLPTLVRGFEEAGLPVELIVETDGRALAPGADLSAYRVIQEALTNTLKHAHARSVRVEVRSDADGVELEVSDDGRGQAATNGDGKGLIGMRERVAFFGGQFRAGPRPEGGFAVWARFPLPE